MFGLVAGLLLQIPMQIFPSSTTPDKPIVTQSTQLYAGSYGFKFSGNEK
jgi:hypothetical protein